MKGWLCLAKINLRDKILNADDIKKEVVPVEEWDCELEVRGLSGKERNSILNKVMNKQSGEMDLDTLYTTLLIKSVYDPETGEKVFEEKDRDMLSGKSGAALEKVAQVASRLSGLDNKGVQNAVKN